MCRNQGYAVTFPPEIKMSVDSGIAYSRVQRRFKTKKPHRRSVVRHLFMWFFGSGLSGQCLDGQRFVGPVGLFDGFVHGVGSGKNYGHTAVSHHFRLAEDADLYARFG